MYSKVASGAFKFYRILLVFFKMIVLSAVVVFIYYRVKYITAYLLLYKQFT